MKSEDRPGPGIIVLRLLSHYQIHIAHSIKNFLGAPLGTGNEFAPAHPELPFPDKLARVGNLPQPVVRDALGACRCSDLKILIR